MFHEITGEMFVAMDFHYIILSRIILPVACLSAFAGVASAAGAEQSDGYARDTVPEIRESLYDGRHPGIRFAYDLDFEMNFDNREFDHSHILPSMTIFGARLTPSVGAGLVQKDGTKHRLMVGIDVMKDFGRSPVESSDPESEEVSPRQDNWDLFGELLIYYQLQKRLGKTDFSLTAGIFPRRFLGGEYSTAFVSDSLRWYDNNLEGLLLTFRRPASYFEVGCDWMGKAGIDRRERFMIFSSGRGDVSGLVTLGYSAYMYHFAGSANAPGVVDNILLNPYVDLDFARCFKTALPLQRLHISAGWLQSLQNDRELVHEYVAPGGLEVVAGIRNWNVGIENRFFFGQNMMPYYNTLGTGGEKYGDLLYRGDPFYRLRDISGWGIYDRLELYYAPVISRFIDLKVAAVLHFSGGYAGWQQMVTVAFNLQELLSGTGASR